MPVVGAYCTISRRRLQWRWERLQWAYVLLQTRQSQCGEDLPKNLCPLIKSSYGFAITEKCPYFYFSDVVVGETTCDGKKKMYEYMSEFKDVF